MSHTLSTNGVDETTGFPFQVVVSVDAGQTLYAEVQCHVFSPSSEGEALIPHPNYVDNSWWDLQDSETRSTLREKLSQRLDDLHIPVAVKNDTIRLIFDYMLSANEVVSGVFVHTKNMCYVGGDEIINEEEEEEEWLRRMSDMTMQEDFFRRTPASLEAVEALEKVTIRDVERETSCTVCLEEFLFGSEVTKMPCSHVFHGSCIVRWLEDRRFCPLCRFELPPAEETVLDDMELPDMIMVESTYY